MKISKILEGKYKGYRLYIEKGKIYIQISRKEKFYFDKTTIKTYDIKERVGQPPDTQDIMRRAVVLNALGGPMAAATWAFEDNSTAIINIEFLDGDTALVEFNPTFEKTLVASMQ